MLKRRSKHFALLLVLAMLATMFVGLGTASATSLPPSTVGAIPVVSSITPTSQSLAKIVITESQQGDFASGETFALTMLTGGVAFNNAVADTVVGTYTSATWTASSTTTRVYTIGAMNYDPTYGLGKPASITIPITANITSVGTGAIEVNVQPTSSAMAGGNVTVGNFTSGGATVSALTSPTVASGVATLGTIRILENSPNGIPAPSTNNTNTVVLKLPAGISWPILTNNLIVTGTNGRAVTANSSGDNNLTLTIAGSSNVPGIYDIPTSNVYIDSSVARMGAVIVQVSGTANNVTPSSLTIGTYGNYGVTASIASVKDVLAGKFMQKTDNITVSETIAASLIAGRDITITLPSGVDITGIEKVNDSFNLSQPSSIANVDNSLDLTVNQATPTSGTPGSATFRLVLSIAANFTGDITATIAGAGIDSQSLVVAHAVAPGTISATSTDIKIGAQSQPVGDIVITEAQADSFLKTYDTTAAGATANNGAIKVTLTQGVAWSKTPTVAVTTGDLAIQPLGYYLATTNAAQDTLIIPLLAESTVASTITISNNLLTLDRSVPAGPIMAKLGGGSVGTGTNAVVENYTTSGAAGTFDFATVSQGQVGNVVTPISGETSNVGVFTVGSTSYTLNGAAQTAFAAPYIKNNRTFMAVRDVASVLGIDQNNVLWDGTRNTVTLMKGDKVVQLTLGSATMLINGAPVTMDVACEAPDGRAMLPAAWVANAFGASATFDATANTVTINS